MAGEPAPASAVRRPGRFPEGTVSIEAKATGGGADQPVRTLTMKYSSVSEQTNATHASVVTTH